MINVRIITYVGIMILRNNNMYACILSICTMFPLVNKHFIIIGKPNYIYCCSYNIINVQHIFNSNTVPISIHRISMALQHKRIAGNNIHKTIQVYW